MSSQSQTDGNLVSGDSSDLFVPYKMVPVDLNDLSLLMCSLPKDQDCHELWSKRRKKVLRDPGVEKKSDSLAEAAVSHSGSGNQWSPESEASNTKHSDVLSPTATSQRRHC